jgi:putative toxin-antitoxin system antitoxin component (TIGR02293 family)
MAESQHLDDVSTLLGGRAVVARKLTKSLDLVTTVRRGLTFESFVRLRDELEMTSNELARHLSIPSRTLARRKTQKRFDPAETERLVGLARILARARLVLGTKEKARRWLTLPNRALGGALPLDLIDTGIGAREVENVLGRIEHGVYS